MRHILILLLLTLVGWTNGATSSSLFELASNPGWLLDRAIAFFGGIRKGNPGEEKELYDEGIRLRDTNMEQAYTYFKMAWELYNETERLGLKHSIPEFEIYDVLHHAAFMLGNLEEALALTNAVLDRYSDTMPDPDRENFQKSKRIIRLVMVEKFLAKNGGRLEAFPVEQQIQSAKELLDTPYYDYCQDKFAAERAVELAKNPKLFCRLDDRGRHPYLVYAPLKEEVLNLDPLVVLIYDLISPEETEELRSRSESKLNTATLASSQTESLQATDYTIRISKAAWIPSAQEEKLTNFLESVTGMDSLSDDEGCEPYQVGRYGIGGHYIPHFDYYFGDLTGGPPGNRIATLMLYFNDVEEGGGTVFSHLKIRVPATKGAGLFWYNCHRNETIDPRTFHGGCPVIRGEKWVVNKWYRFRGQFQHKRCGKTPEEPFTLDDFNLPDWMKKRPLLENSKGSKA